MSETILRFGIPAGSLQEATGELFKRAGYNIKFSSRSYYPDNRRCRDRMPADSRQEMARYVEQGILDAGITGHDWVVENGADVVEICELIFSKVSRRPVRWVLCVPEDSPVQTSQDLQGKRIATEAVGLTTSFFAEARDEGHASNSPGGPRKSSRRGWPMPSSKSPRREFAAGQQSADRRRSPAEHAAAYCQQPRHADPWKQDKLDNIALMLQSCLAAEGKVG